MVTETEPKNGGSPDCASPDKNCTSSDKKVSECTEYRCISNISGTCMHDPCTPCDRDGNTFTVLPVIDAEVGNAALRLVEDLSRGKVLHQIVNADTMDEALRLVRVLKGHKRPVVTEEPSPTPHPFLDVAFLKLKAVR